ncbi:MAG TPA: hydrogenase maturation nickel metallochaperone HypA [Burkholderiaceae bacterium]|jgi:hydrogenase nickel incorporation protein HypA/HybF|nr:hydrogenase maturation nickel metallochaperone HypA [Burkholderiaceae bacterium]HPE02112.1 hydrogenase maturation nickel metallochaperone HypA [Burkholderiaceae bacterium]HRZ01303.1 hydrogenase maturation nickel metallochaperone HypA [Burkholderiaceae bacterium]
MHEMSLAQSIVEIVERTAAANGGGRVSAVRLEIGALSHVEVEALRFCFDAVTRGGAAEGARLELDSPPGQAWCMPCGATVPLARLGDACPHCGSHQLQVTQGEEMRVKDIELI